MYKLLVIPLAMLLVLPGCVKQEPVKTFQGHDENVNAVALSPDGKSFASGSSDRSIIIWDIDTGNITKRLELHRSRVNFLRYYPGGEYLLSAAGDSRMFLWDVASGKKLRHFVSRTGQIEDISVSPAGNVIAAVEYNVKMRKHSLLVLNPRTLTVNKRIIRTGQGCCVSPDGKRIYYSSNGQIMRYLVEEGRSEKFATNKNTTPLVMSPGGKYLACIRSEDPRYHVDIYTVDKKTVFHSIDVSNHVMALFNAVQFLPGEQLVAVPENNYVLILDIDTGEMVNRIGSSDFNQTLMDIAFLEDEQRVLAAYQIHFSDSNLLMWEY